MTQNVVTQSEGGRGCWANSLVTFAAKHACICNTSVPSEVAYLANGSEKLFARKQYMYAGLQTDEDGAAATAPGRAASAVCVAAVVVVAFGLAAVLAYFLLPRLKAHEPLGFDCAVDATEVDSWVPAKKAWCCQHSGHGCEMMEVTWDCDAGLSIWRSHWPKEKQAWCCERRGKGCPGEKANHTKADGPDAQS
mmetsp:Transcript_7873/g.22653  ORF Transcript_7873/g.22653 Transcript_7873/m.22653 type:complete len:193 (-) Transcript_7873:217-795(-)